MASYISKKVLIPYEGSSQTLASAPEWLSSMDVTAALKITRRWAREDSVGVGCAAPADLTDDRQPGIEHRAEQGKSVLAPWVSRRSSAGVVLVHHDETRDSVEVVLFGFCAPGTRHLGDIFCDDPDRFWPTTADTKRRFGAFVCPMRFQDDEEVTLADHQVIELPAAMLDSVRGASANSSEALTD